MNPIEQHLATRRVAGLFDFSFMSWIELDGSGARAFVEHVQTRSLATLAAGRIVYTLLLNDDASVLIDATLWQRADGCWWLFTGRRSDVGFVVARARGFDVRIRDHSGEFAILALQGPASGRALAKLAGDAVVRELRYFRFVEARLAGILGCIGRLGYSGELGYEILVPIGDATAIRRAILAQEIVDCGFEAANILRIESGYVLFDREVTGRENPFELNLERLVDLDGRHFAGRDAFIALRGAVPTRHLVGLEIADHAASPLLPVARVTSECDSPVLKRRIGLGFAAPDLSDGSRVRLADGRLATTVRLPFYDPSRRLPRGTPL